MVFNGISLLKCVADFVLQKQREKSYNVIDHIIDQMHSLWKTLNHIIFKSNQIKYIYLSQAQKHRKYHILEHIYKLETGGIDSQGLFNTQPPTGESVFAMMLT